MINNKKGGKDNERGEKQWDRRHKDQEAPTITNNSNGIKTFPLKRTVKEGEKNASKNKYLVMM